MKASICTKYGRPEVLQIQEVEKPTPKENEVLIKIIASSVTAADSMMRRGSPYFGRLFIGLTKPKNPITGTGFSGIVEDLGISVSKFKIGDAVFGESILGAGTNTEYVTVTEDGILAIKPKNITDSEAAVVCDGALTSMSFLKDIAQIKKGQYILINGASGSLGSAAVQIAKSFGAHVTGVCSTANIEMVKSLGADEVIDYSKENFLNQGLHYDVIYDSVGKMSYPKSKKILSEKGVFVSPVLSVSLLLQVLISAIFGSKKAKFSATGLRPANELTPLLLAIKSMMELGELKSIIDRTYPLNQIADAHRYVDSGRKKGNVVLLG